jgi:hypothetical protein
MNDTQLCNLALGEIGDSYSITDINETSNQAAVCRLFFEPTRDAMLRSHQWNFARQLADLSALSTDPVFGWDYQYALPSDFIRLVEFNGLDAWQTEDDFQIANGPSGGLVLLTDEDEASIVYIQRVTDANLFDPLFVEAFTLRLAARICTKLTKDDAIRDRLHRDAKEAMGRARQTDANESRPRRVGSWLDSDLAMSRFSSQP